MTRAGRPRMTAGGRGCTVPPRRSTVARASPATSSSRATAAMAAWRCRTRRASWQTMPDRQQRTGPRAPTAIKRRSALRATAAGRRPPRTTRSGRATTAPTRSGRAPTASRATRSGCATTAMGAPAAPGQLEDKARRQHADGREKLLSLPRPIRMPIVPREREALFAPEGRLGSRAREGRRVVHGAVEVCHSRATCDACHGTRMPHPPISPRATREWPRSRRMPPASAVTRKLLRQVPYRNRAKAMTQGDGSPRWPWPWVGMLTLAAHGGNAAGAKNTYIGSNTCLTCHHEYARQWAQLDHSKALLRPGRAPENAGCEACHGPGGRHATRAGARRDPLVDAAVAGAAVGGVPALSQPRVTAAGWKSSPHAGLGVSCLFCHEYPAHRPCEEPEAGAGRTVWGLPRRGGRAGGGRKTPRPSPRASPAPPVTTPTRERASTCCAPTRRCCAASAMPPTERACARQAIRRTAGSSSTARRRKATRAAAKPATTHRSSARLATAPRCRTPRAS